MPHVCIIIVVIIKHNSYYFYFLLQYKKECYCGNDGYDKYGTSRNCTLNCDDTSKECGGNWAISIYLAKGMW